VNVITKEALQHFQHTEVQSFANPVQAANGSDVAMEGFCKVLLEIQVADPKGDKRTGVIPIDVLVGQTALSILSTCKLGRLGWKTTVGKHGVDMTLEATGVRATDVSIWHDTPWVLVKPYLGNYVKLGLEPPVLSAVLGDMVSVLTPDEMAAQRLRGHIPFEPSCETCQSCKGVHQHRCRKQDKRLVTEIHADFAYISQGMEMGIEEQPSAHKILILKRSILLEHQCDLVWTRCG
jgi:hypothetical protein